MSNAFGLTIESLVSVLLVLTIAYCMVLNRRLKRLKADEQALKAVIVELVGATDTAERSIAGLKLTVRDCDQTLGERLRTAERFAAEFDRQIEAGQEMLNRLARMTGRSLLALDAGVATSGPPDAKATLAAAQAFADRARLRINGRAA